MKKMKKLLAMGIVCTMIFGLTACGGAKDASSGQDAAQSEAADQTDQEELVELTVFGHMLSVDKIGIQTDPVAKKIEEDLGIRLNIIDSNTNVADETNKIAAYMASNDMPDIFFVPDINVLKTAIEANQVIKLNDLWTKENCPNMLGDNPDAQNRQDFFANQSFEGDRYGVQMWGGTGGASFPTVGMYVPWDIYKQAGYPEVNNLDDLVEAVEMMAARYPETESGQKTYGVGGWFAEGLGWGDWMVSLLQNAFGYQTDDCFVFTFDMETNDLREKPAILDAEGPWWESVEFMYKMNQKGLIDPDSVTQKYDQWQEKAYSGRYLLVGPGWEAAPIKEKSGLSYVALKPFENSNIVMDWSGELTGYTYAISSTCKHPEKALQLLDYLWSPEGSRLTHSGIEGESWEMVDGKAEFTQKYLEDKAALQAAELNEKYAVYKYGMFTGYALNVVSPADNNFFDLTMSAKYEEKNLSEAEKDALAYYGVDSMGEIYRNPDVKNYVFRWPEYSTMLPTPPEDIKKNRTDLGNFVYREYLNCVYAKNDAEFEAAKQKIMDGAAEYKVEEIFDWYKAAFAEAKEAVDDYIK